MVDILDPGSLEVVKSLEISWKHEVNYLEYRENGILVMGESPLRPGFFYNVTNMTRVHESRDYYSVPPVATGANPPFQEGILRNGMVYDRVTLDPKLVVQPGAFSLPYCSIQIYRMVRASTRLRALAFSRGWCFGGSRLNPMNPTRLTRATDTQEMVAARPLRKIRTNGRRFSWFLI
jgi:hypothetical protein